MSDMFRIDPAVFAREPWRFYAETVYERIEKRFDDKLDELKDTEELTIEVPLLDGARITVDTFGFQNPNFIIVHGVDSETGNRVEALLPHMNIQLIFTVSENQPAEEPRRKPIGFIGEPATQD